MGGCRNRHPLSRKRVDSANSIPSTSICPHHPNFAHNFTGTIQRNSPCRRTRAVPVPPQVYVHTLSSAIDEESLTTLSQSAFPSTSTTPLAADSSLVGTKDWMPYRTKARGLTPVGGRTNRGTIGGLLDAHTYPG